MSEAIDAEPTASLASCMGAQRFRVSTPVGTSIAASVAQALWGRRLLVVLDKCGAPAEAVARPPDHPVSEGSTSASDPA